MSISMRTLIKWRKDALYLQDTGGLYKELSTKILALTQELMDQEWMKQEEKKDASSN